MKSIAHGNLIDLGAMSAVINFLCDLHKEEGRGLQAQLCTSFVRNKNGSADLTAEDETVLQANKKRLTLIPRYESGHWTGLVVDGSNHMITFYDSLNVAETVKDLENLSRKVIAPVLSKGGGRWRARPYAGLEQTDRVNCGVYVLLFFEMYLFDVRCDTTDLTDDKLNSLRARYVHMVAESEFD